MDLKESGREVICYFGTEAPARAKIETESEALINNLTNAIAEVICVDFEVREQ